MIQQQTRVFSLFRRAIAAFVLTAFVSTNHFSAPLSAVPISPPPAQKSFPRNLASLQIPEQTGKIQEVFQGTGEDLLILVQDAHSVPDAQRNIEKLIEHLQKNYGLDSVGIEGVSSELDAQIFRSFPDKEILHKVFDDYFDRGELTGATAAAIFSDAAHETMFRGVEEWPVYEEGLRFYLEAMRKSQELTGKLRSEKEDLQKKKQALYSKELFEIDRLLSDFETNHTNLEDLLKKLAAIKAPEKGSELALLLEETTQGDHLAAIDAEVRKIAMEIKVHLMSLGKTASPAFNDKYQEFQTSRITPQAFALYLQGWAKQASLPLSISRQLAHLMTNQKRLSRIEGARFFKDFDRYAKSVKVSLFRNAEEKKLDEASRRLDLEAKLISLELNPEEWAEISQRPMEQDFRFHAAFYQNAAKRDRIFFHQLTAQMNERRSRAALLVAGGFHTSGLTQILKEKGISYVLLTPHIKSVPEKNIYREQMRGDVSWKNYFRVENGRVDLSGAFARAGRDKLLAAARNRPELVKNWRDQIILDLVKKEKISTAGQYTPFLDELGSETSKAEWQIKVEKLIAGLRSLDSKNQLTEANILPLLNPATLQAYAPANAVSSTAKISSEFMDVLSLSRAEVRIDSETSVKVQASGKKPLDLMAEILRRVLASDHPQIIPTDIPEYFDRRILVSRTLLIANPLRDEERRESDLMQVQLIVRAYPGKWNNQFSVTVQETAPQGSRLKRIFLNSPNDLPEHEHEIFHEIKLQTGETLDQLLTRWTSRSELRTTAEPVAAETAKEMSGGMMIVRYEIARPAELKEILEFILAELGKTESEVQSIRGDLRGRIKLMGLSDESKKERFSQGDKIQLTLQPGRTQAAADDTYDLGDAPAAAAKPEAAAGAAPISADETFALVEEGPQAQKAAEKKTAKISAEKAPRLQKAIHAILFILDKNYQAKLDQLKDGSVSVFIKNSSEGPTFRFLPKNGNAIKTKPMGAGTDLRLLAEELAPATGEEDVAPKIVQLSEQLSRSERRSAGLEEALLVMIPVISFAGVVLAALVTSVLTGIIDSFESIESFLKENIWAALLASALMPVFLEAIFNRIFEIDFVKRQIGRFLLVNRLWTIHFGRKDGDIYKYGLDFSRIPKAELQAVQRQVYHLWKEGMTFTIEYFPSGYEWDTKKSFLLTHLKVISGPKKRVLKARINRYLLDLQTLKHAISQLNLEKSAAERAARQIESAISKLKYKAAQGYVSSEDLAKTRRDILDLKREYLKNTLPLEAIRSEERALDDDERMTPALAATYLVEAEHTIANDGERRWVFRAIRDDEVRFGEIRPAIAVLIGNLAFSDLLKHGSVRRERDGKLLDIREREVDATRIQKGDLLKVSFKSPEEKTEVPTLGEAIVGSYASHSRFMMKLEEAVRWGKVTTVHMDGTTLNVLSSARLDAIRFVEQVQKAIFDRQAGDKPSYTYKTNPEGTVLEIDFISPEPHIEDEQGFRSETRTKSIDERYEKVKNDFKSYEKLIRRVRVARILSIAAWVISGVHAALLAPIKLYQVFTGASNPIGDTLETALFVGVMVSFFGALGFSTWLKSGLNDVEINAMILLGDLQPLINDPSTETDDKIEAMQNAMAVLKTSHTVGGMLWQDFWGEIHLIGKKSSYYFQTLRLVKLLDTEYLKGEGFYSKAAFEKYLDQRKGLMIDLPSDLSQLIQKAQYAIANEQIKEIPGVLDPNTLVDLEMHFRTADARLQATLARIQKRNNRSEARAAKLTRLDGDTQNNLYWNYTLEEPATVAEIRAQLKIMEPSYNVISLNARSGRDKKVLNLEKTDETISAGALITASYVRDYTVRSEARTMSESDAKKLLQTLQTIHTIEVKKEKYDAWVFSVNDPKGADFQAIFAAFLALTGIPDERTWREKGGIIRFRYPHQNQERKYQDNIPLLTLDSPEVWGLSFDEGARFYIALPQLSFVDAFVQQSARAVEGINSNSKDKIRTVVPLAGEILKNALVFYQDLKARIESAAVTQNKEAFLAAVDDLDKIVTSFGQVRKALEGRLRFIKNQFDADFLNKAQIFQENMVHDGLTPIPSVFSTFQVAAQKFDSAFASPLLDRVAQIFQRSEVRSRSFMGGIVLIFSFAILWGAVAGVTTFALTLVLRMAGIPVSEWRGTIALVSIVLGSVEAVGVVALIDLLRGEFGRKVQPETEPLNLPAVYEQKINALLSQIKDQDPAVRREAAQGLREWLNRSADQRVVDALTQALMDTDTNVRLRAAAGFAAINRQAEGMAALAAPLLRTLVQDDDSAVRYWTAQALGRVGKDDRAKTVPVLIALLSDPESKVRGAAAYALEQIEPTGPAARLAADALLLVLQNDSSDTVRKLAGAALAKIPENLRSEARAKYQQVTRLELSEAEVEQMRQDLNLAPFAGRSAAYEDLASFLERVKNFPKTVDPQNKTTFAKVYSELMERARAGGVGSSTGRQTINQQLDILNRFLDNYEIKLSSRSGGTDSNEKWSFQYSSIRSEARAEAFSVPIKTDQLGKEYYLHVINQIQGGHVLGIVAAKLGVTAADIESIEFTPFRGDTRALQATDSLQPKDYIAVKLKVPATFIRSEVREIAQEIVRNFRNKNARPDIVFQKRAAQVIANIKLPAFLPELEAAEAQAHQIDQATQVANTGGAIAALNDLQDIVFVDYIITHEGLKQMDKNVAAVIEALVQAAHDDAAAEAKFITRITVPDGFAQYLKVRDHNLRDKVEFDITDNKIIFYNPKLPNYETYLNGEPTITVTDSLNVKGLVLLSDKLGDGDIQYDGKEGIQTAARLLAAARVKVAESLSKKDFDLLVQAGNQPNVFRVASRNALNSLGSVVRITAQLRAALRFKASA